MKKKVLMGVLLALIGASAVFGQQKSSDVRGNWLSGEIGVLSIGVRYERMINGYLSVGVNAYSKPFLFGYGADAFLSFYPARRTFFLGLGVGYHQDSIILLYNPDTYADTYVTGLGVVPQIGWKVDVGQAGKFFIQPGIKVPVTLGIQTTEGLSGSTYGLGYKIAPYFSMGGSF